jgi:hypothetical protein
MMAVLERRQARVEDDIGFEIKDALDVLQRHVEEKPDARRQGFQKPDMGDRRGERNMPHALAAHPRQGHLNAAFLADDVLIFHPLVFAAQALVVLDRTEDPGAEKSIAFGFEGAVIDCLRLFDLAEGPGQNLLRACDRNLDLIESLRLRGRTEEIHDLLIHCHLPMLGPARRRRMARRKHSNKDTPRAARAARRF